MAVMMRWSAGLSAGSVLLHGAAVLLGAPLAVQWAHTGLWAVLAAALTAAPLTAAIGAGTEVAASGNGAGARANSGAGGCEKFGAEPRLSGGLTCVDRDDSSTCGDCGAYRSSARSCFCSRGRGAWWRVAVLLAPRAGPERAAALPAYGALAGSWLGACCLPLDWGSAWLQWPLPAAYGAVLGYAAAALGGVAFGGSHGGVGSCALAGVCAGGNAASKDPGADEAPGATGAIATRKSTRAKAKVP